MPKPCRSSAAQTLLGTVMVPGDKSISHRAVMFAGLAEGTTRIEGLLRGEDVEATLRALTAMGAKSWFEGETLVIEGVGAKGLSQPSTPLDMGNSGTTTRLLMGIITGHPITVSMVGDASLSKRPMGRVITPLSSMGAVIEANDSKLPLTLTGSKNPTPIEYVLPVASAQVKSALLLAGLRANGTTRVTEKEPTRDHTERMLKGFGVDVRVEEQTIAITGPAILTAPKDPIIVPADPSSAAFPMVAGCLAENGQVVLKGVLLNPTRTGLLQTLLDMGANIIVENQQLVAGEQVGDLVVTGGAPLKGVHVPAARAPSMIDEYPVLSMAAACAKGTSRFEGIGELRVKESDRLEAVATGLRQCGVTVRTGSDWMEIDGVNGAPKGGATVATLLDHRLAMSFLVLGMRTATPVTVDDISPIATSFPSFLPLMQGLGLQFEIG